MATKNKPEILSQCVKLQSEKGSSVGKHLMVGLDFLGRCNWEVWEKMGSTMKPSHPDLFAGENSPWL